MVLSHATCSNEACNDIQCKCVQCVTNATSTYMKECGHTRLQVQVELDRRLSEQDQHTFYNIYIYTPLIPAIHVSMYLAWYYCHDIPSHMYNAPRFITITPLIVRLSIYLNNMYNMSYQLYVSDDKITMQNELLKILLLQSFLQ